MNDYDPDETKRELRETYREQTGHDLPEHVVENLKLLAPKWTDPAEIESIREQARRRAKKGKIDRVNASLAVVAAAAISALAGYAVGLALAATYGLAVIGIVTLLAGAAIGGVALAFSGQLS